MAGGKRGNGMNMIGKLRALFGGAQQDEQGVAWHMDRFIEILEPAIFELPDYRSRLEPAAHHAHDYCTRLATAVPGPYAVGHGQHGSDPLISALFPQREDIGTAFGRSVEVRDRIHEFTANGNAEVYALLGMRQRVSAAPRTNGEALPAGWSKPRFADHTVRSLDDSEDAVRQQFAAAAFDSLRHGFLNQVQNLRRCKKLMHSERELLREVASDDDANGADEAHAMLASDLSPSGLLDGLVAWLNAPQAHLRLEMGHDDATVIMPHSDPAQRGLQKLELPALVGADRRRWPICVIRFEREEALAAVSRESVAHRYIVI